MTKEIKHLELPTPVNILWEGILLLPIFGLLDSKRTQEVMETMLAKITQTQAKIIILDISGVATVDSAVANHLIQMSKATELMGCACVISGISSAIAQTMVSLGVDLGPVVTVATPQDALKYAFSTRGLEVTKVGSRSRR